MRRTNDVIWSVVEQTLHSTIYSCNRPPVLPTALQAQCSGGEAIKRLPTTLTETFTFRFVCILASVFVFRTEIDPNLLRNPPNVNVRAHFHAVRKAKIMYGKPVPENHHSPGDLAVSILSIEAHLT